LAPQNALDTYNSLGGYITLERTNQYILSRLSAFSGELRMTCTEDPGYRVVTHWRPIIREFLMEAGRNNPAIFVFEIHGGVGYLFPVRPIGMEGTASLLSHIPQSKTPVHVYH